MSSTAVADVLQQDADFSARSTFDDQVVQLGNIPRGATRHRQVSLRLRCPAGQLEHVEAGQSIQIDYFSASLDGGAWNPARASATSTSLGPVPASWPDDGQPCPRHGLTLQDNGNSVVTFTVPSQLGRHRLRVKFEQTITPAGADDASDVVKGPRFTMRFDFIVVRG
jgi:hypothetical protein